MTTFWQALKTMFITIGHHHQTSSSSSRKGKHAKDKDTIDYHDSTIIDDNSYLGKNPSGTINNQHQQISQQNIHSHQQQQQQYLSPELDSKNNNSNIPSLIVTSTPSQTQLNHSNSNNSSSNYNGDFINELDIQWPTWAIRFDKRKDLQPVTRNGMDTDSERLKNGFKGRNYVYQDRKFIAKYYWKGFSTITNSSSNESISDEIDGFEEIKDDDTISAPPPLLSISKLEFQDRMLVGVVYWNSNCEGPPGCVHGGALASLFDDSMACCIRYHYNNNYEEDENDETTIVENGEQQQQPPQQKQLSTVSQSTSSSPPQPKKYAVTANLSVNYKKFVPLNSVSLVETKIERRQGKKIFVQSIIKDQNGFVRAEATAVWIVINMSAPSSSTGSFPSSPAISSPGQTPRAI